MLFLTIFLSRGCGVSFHQHFNGTETFKSFDVSGDFVAGSKLTLTTVVTQTYPVPLQISCYYEDATKLTDDQLKVALQERAAKIGETVLPAAPDRKPQDKLDKSQQQTLTFDFTIADPGQYFAVCITTAAPENGYGKVFKVRAA